MNAENIFVDSNIFLYLLDKDVFKQQKAVEILSLHPIISPQVIFENINVAIRKFGFDKSAAISHGAELLKLCILVLDTESTIQKSFELMSRDMLPVFDSRIIASALAAECSILFSEDFQHLRVFEGKLTVINPFSV